MKSEASLRTILQKADLELNGSGPGDPQILDDRAYSMIASGGSLAIGEAYMDKLWDCSDLSVLISRIHEKKIYRDIVALDHLPLIIKGVFSNLQSRARSFMVAREHYDLGDDLYTAMLDKRMVYTSGMWKGASSLEEAQERKLDQVCQKLALQSGDRLLDIGCGWGSLMKFAAENYGVRAVGLTVSEGQTALGRKMCEGLPVEFIIQDYREYYDAEGFDHVASIEMIEAVGPKNFRTYFEKAHELLRPGGHFFLQAIGSEDAVPKADRWMDKYIFRNGILPSLPQIERASRGLFNFEYLDNIGPDYDPTLMAWWERFDAAYPTLKANNPVYDERFYRMWKFYLQSCAGLFRAKVTHDWHILFSKRD